MNKVGFSEGQLHPLYLDGCCLTYSQICSGQVHYGVFHTDTLSLGTKIIYCTPSRRYNKRYTQDKSEICPKWLPMGSVVVAFVLIRVPVDGVREELHSARCISV